MIERLALYFVAITVAAVGLIGLTVMAITMPWWVTAWIVVFIAAACLCEWKFG